MEEKKPRSAVNKSVRNNIFSCDVEDWYQSSHDLNAPISGRVYRNVHSCLEVLDELKVRGTFFVQGLVAEQRPEVVRLIESTGHEIGTHGYSHRPVFRMTREQFKDDLSHSISLIEDITGKRVKGYRAPDFSIFNNTSFAFEVLQECRIEYDSSMFPIRMRRYGNPGCELAPHKIKGFELIELPVTVYVVSKVKIPVAGGGYIRLLPNSFLKMALKSVNARGRPFVMYCHPYEFDPDEWSHIREKIPVWRKIHQGLGRRGFPEKVRKMLLTNDFCSCAEAIEKLHELDLLPEIDRP